MNIFELLNPATFEISDKIEELNSVKNVKKLPLFPWCLVCCYCLLRALRFASLREILTLHGYSGHSSNQALDPLMHSKGTWVLEALYLVKFCRPHGVKSVRIRSYSGLHFPVFSPNVGKCRPE